jgi:hypothetical protein
MKLWNLFKKKKEEPPQIQKISKDELKNWLTNKKTEIKQQQQQLFEEVKERTSQLIQELKKEIIVLNNVNFEEKKEKERIKSIVKENFKNYIISLERLIQKLQEIEESNIINKINTIFHYFETKSKANYEKATYLIGKEMAATKESIRSFFKDLEIIIKNHKKDIEKSQTIESIKEKINQYEEAQKTTSTITKELEEQNNKIKDLNNILQTKEKEINKIKESQEYTEHKKKNQELKIKNQELEKDTNYLKQLINFKSLANYYHKYEKEMNTVKEYKENFKQTLNKTKGEELLHLLKESKLHTENISSLIDKINNTEQELTSTKIEHTELKNINDTITKLKYEIEQINSSKENKQKTLNKFEENENNALNQLKEKFTEINIELY